MSIPSPEKDSLLGPTVYKKIVHQILKKEVFFGQPFNVDQYYDLKADALETEKFPGLVSSL